MPESEPRATYRVQLHGGFGFDDAAAIASYLGELGISHIYCSPCLQARSGSPHGYDVIDHGSLNRELGGRAAYERMHESLAANGVRQILDIVPNHMAVADEGNRWWWDVLANGRRSKFAAYFDIDWNAPEPALKEKVSLPVLDDHYGRVLDAGTLRLQRRGDEVIVAYRDRVFPLSPLSTEGWPTQDRELDEHLAKLNAAPEALHDLLEHQHYRLSYWKTASHELDYRRFFDVNDLAALRLDNPDVFDDVHRLVFELVAEGRVDGLRVDHIDGLADPRGYLETLRSASGISYVVVEKILEPGEQLPDGWPVDGTTGYDFMNRVGGLFVDPAGEGPLTRFYEQFTGAPADLDEATRAAKLLVLDDLLASDVERLLSLLLRICERRLRFRDFTRHELRAALRETMASFEVYRTYVTSTDPQPHPQDAAYIERATRAARAARSDLDPELFDFLHDLLLLRYAGEYEEGFVARFQQTTGAAMAKALEDTVFYSFNRLVSLNEVGGSPAAFGVSPQAFHDATTDAAARWPRSMLTTSTHDTKRSEDVRARLHLLSEIPARWAEAVDRWAAHNEQHKTSGLPDRNMEYLLYQVLVGAWPVGSDRAIAYMEKASKEAKDRTSWIAPDSVYDGALATFVRAVVADPEFGADLDSFVRPLIWPGRVNSLAQTLVKLIAPGVPDTYQGCELWDLSLVDPDNRRPVDYAVRAQLLRWMASASPEDILARADDGAPKLWTVKHALDVRRSHSGAFAAPDGYVPLGAAGPKAHHVVAFARREEIVCVVPRLVIGAGDDWSGTAVEVPRGRYTNVLTGDGVEGPRLDLGELFARFPVALLTRSP